MLIKGRHGEEMKRWDLKQQSSVAEEGHTVKAVLCGPRVFNLLNTGGAERQQRRLRLYISLTVVQ